MSVIQFDADELQPLVDMAVETAVRRLRAERSAGDVPTRNGEQGGEES